MEIRYYMKTMFRLFAILGGCVLLYLFYMEKDPMEFEPIQSGKNAAEHESTKNMVEVGEAGEIGENDPIIENDLATFENRTTCLVNIAYAAAMQSLSARPLNANSVFGVQRKEFHLEFATDKQKIGWIALGNNASFMYPNNFRNNDYGYANMASKQSFGFNSDLLCWCTYCKIIVPSALNGMNDNKEM